MTFSVKQFLADKQLLPFRFEDIDGVERELPNLMMLTAPEVDTLMVMMDADPAGALATISPELAEVITKTPVVALIPLANAYVAHCTEAGLGEALASPASSKSTARPSKRTSPGSTRKTPTRKR